MRKHSAITATHTKCLSFCPTVTHTGTHAPTLCRLGAHALMYLATIRFRPGRNYDIQDSDSIYMTVSSLVPRLLNLSLPSSLSSSDSFDLSYQKCRAMLPANTDFRSLRALHTCILAPVLRQFRMLTYSSVIRSRTNYMQC